MADSSDTLTLNYNALMDFSKFAINMTVVLNGAAAVALLRFGDNSSSLISATAMENMLLWLGMGAFAGCLGIIFAFFTRWRYYNDAVNSRRGKTTELIENAIREAIVTEQSESDELNRILKEQNSYLIGKIYDREDKKFKIINIQNSNDNIKKIYLYLTRIEYSDNIAIYLNRFAVFVTVLSYLCFGIAII